MLKHAIMFAAIAGLAFALTGPAQAVTIEWVEVGDAGNAGDTAWDAVEGYPGGLGDVSYTYYIGKYEVTNNQYAEFLNAAAGAGDPNGLYNADMGADPRGGITESAGVYSVKTNMGDKPVNYVSWYDTLRFANWMHNGKGAGGTETGAYDMSLGADADRETGAQVWLANIDEWWKAAFYDATGPDYWDSATQSNDVNPPTVTVDANGSGSAGDTGVFANWDFQADWNGQDGNVTTVGTNGGPSPYGTHDQNGNVWEWCEGAPMWDADLRITMGGSWDTEAGGAELRPYIEASSPDFEDAAYGFRLVTSSVTEPPVPGDADGDGDVDLADMGFFEAQFGGAAPGSNSADFDDDGDVDLDDLAIMRGNFGFVSPATPSAATPEPATMGLLMFGALGVLMRRRRS